MKNRREFLRTSLGAAAGAVFLPRLLRAGAPADADPALGDVFGLIRPGGPLALASDRGVPMVDDPLTDGTASAVTFASGDGRWTPSGLEVLKGEGLVTARALPTPGNRSMYARVEFAFDDPTGTVELRFATTHQLIQGKRLFPLRARLSGGAFALLSLSDDLIAGDRQKVVFTPRPGAWHTLELVTFQKSIHARIDGGALALALPDRMRFIPGEPGLRLAAGPGGSSRARRWLVSGVGPSAPILGAIGDSITAGSQLGPEADDYVHQVTRGLGQDYILNTGSGGANTTQDRARFRYEIAPFRPKLVWIESGTNDLTQGLTADQIFANQRAIAAQIDWGGKAVLSTVPPRREYGPALRAERHRLNEMIRRSGFPVVDRAQIVILPGDVDRLRPDFDSGDGTHPNAKGAAAIAAAALPVFQKLV